MVSTSTYFISICQIVIIFGSHFAFWQPFEFGSSCNYQQWNPHLQKRKIWRKYNIKDISTTHGFSKNDVQYGVQVCMTWPGPCHDLCRVCISHVHDWTMTYAGFLFLLRAMHFSSFDEKKHSSIFAGWHLCTCHLLTMHYYHLFTPHLLTDLPKCWKQ